LSSAILRLTPNQLALGVPLTFGLYFFGTVLPSMILIYAILVPRLLKLTGSIATTRIMGGVGMFKTFLTLRTGNAWAHVWAYHALAPHTLIDTPLMVKIFGAQ
jgi:hypothetical protein